MRENEKALILALTFRWPGGGGWKNRFFQFFSGMGRVFLQTKFLAAGSSLGHMSMKKFSDRTYRLGSKITQKEGTGGKWQPWTFFIYFSNHKGDIQPQQILLRSKIVQR